MKKLTKLTALALALALVLGMTAFAGTPSEVTKTVDFTGYTDLSAATVISFTDGAEGAEQKWFKKGDKFAFGTGTLAYDKVFYQTAAENPNWQYITITPINGVNTISVVKAMWENSAQNQNVVGFTLPEAWTYNEDYALVVETGLSVADRNRGSANYHYANGAVPTIGALMTEKVEEVETNVFNPLAYLAMEDANGFGLTRYAQNATSNTTAAYDFAPENKISKLVSVIRPDEATAAEDGSLDIITGIGRMPYVYSYHVAGYTPISKVHGFQHKLLGNELWGYTGYRLYKVSLDAADFTITSSKNVADVDVKDAINVTFSQPISTNVNDANTYESGLSLENLLTVTPEGGEALVYGEDYTVEIAEKSNGTAIYDELTITPVGAWEYGKNYTVGLPTGLKNIARVAYTDATDDETTAEEIKFATVTAPTFDVTLKAYKGLSDAGEELDALEAGTNYLKVTASYASGKVVTNGKVRIEILDGEGNVVKAVTTNRTLTSATTFGAAFKLEAGMTAKAYIEGGVIGEATID